MNERASFFSPSSSLRMSRCFSLFPAFPFLLFMSACKAKDGSNINYYSRKLELHGIASSPSSFCTHHQFLLPEAAEYFLVHFVHILYMSMSVHTRGFLFGGSKKLFPSEDFFPLGNQPSVIIVSGLFSSFYFWKKVLYFVRSCNGYPSFSSIFL